MTTMQMTALDGDPVDVSERALEALAGRVAGEILRPGEPGFDDVVVIWNGLISKRPAIVVQPVCAQDVSETIDFARANGVLLSVKGGGHNVAGTSLTDGGLTIDMSRCEQSRWIRGGGWHRLGAGACSVTSTTPPRPMASQPCSAPTPTPVSLG